jgi:hypothetical protein
MAQSKRTSASYLAESRNIKPLSTAMQQWVEANRSKLKSATAKQKEIFKKYDQMKKAGMLAAKPAAAKPKVTKKVASTSKPKPASKVPERFAAGGKGGKFDNKQRASERFFAGAKGGKYDKPTSRLKMSEHPGLAKNKKKAPKAGDTKTVNGQKYYHDGSKWVKGTYKSTRFKR